MSCLAEAGELHGTQQMSKQPLAFCGGDRYLWDLLHFHTKVPPFKRFVCSETAAASAASRPAAERSRAASSAHRCERAIKCQSLKNVSAKAVVLSALYQHVASAQPLRCRSANSKSNESLTSDYTSISFLVPTVPLSGHRTHTPKKRSP